MNAKDLSTHLDLHAQPHIFSHAVVDIDGRRATTTAKAPLRVR